LSHENTIGFDTKRFCLRTLDPADASEEYISWLNDPEINQYLECRFTTQTMASVEEYILSHNNYSDFLFGVFTSGGEHIGNFSLRTDSNHKNGVLGVIIGRKEYWGEGVVLETRSRILEFAFTELSLHKVSGACYSNNLPAIYNYRRQGWTFVGVQKEQFQSNEARVDNVMFTYFQKDWLDRGQEA